MHKIQRFDSEAVLQQQICDYLRLTYPRTLWRSDYASGLKLTMNQAVQHKRLQSGRAWPDLLIYETNDTYQGLALELKRQGTRIYLRDGSLTADPHIREQAAVLAELEKRGYKAMFVCGFDAARQAIDTYFGGRPMRGVEI